MTKLPKLTKGPIRAYKLFRVRRDGTLGSLFIHRRQVIPVGRSLGAEIHPTKGLALRPGWHASHEPRAPHLSMKGRTWYEVELEYYESLQRPESQGGLWYIAQWMRIIKPVAEAQL